MPTFNFLNMRPGALYEVIITTIDDHGKPHAAPMGVRIVSDNTFLMRSYGETKTLKNLETSSKGVLNVVNEIEPFFYCIFEQSKLSFNWFAELPVLRGAIAWSPFNLLKVSRREEYYELLCSIIEVHVKRGKPKPLCRAESSLLESLIHYTRLKYYEGLGLEEEVSKLKSLILQHLDVVERTGWPKLKSLARKLKKNLC
ncbi:MAG: DUF447 family protein [Candidatus Nezhaarchaeales archaeon]